MDEQDKMISITVLIAGRPYPLKIKEGNEATIRKIVKEVNDKINRFQLTYTSKDKQDCLSMVLLTYAVDLNKVETSTSTSPNSSVPEDLNILDRLAEIENSLDALLQ